MSDKQKIIDKSNKPLFESKKVKVGASAVLVVLFIYASSLISICLANTDKSSQIVSLANLAIVFIGSIASILITGQSAIDWKAVSAVESINSTEYKKEEYIKQEIERQEYISNIVEQKDDEEVFSKPYSCCAMEKGGHENE